MQLTRISQRNTILKYSAKLRLFVRISSLLGRVQVLLSG